MAEYTGPLVDAPQPVKPKKRPEYQPLNTPVAQPAPVVQPAAQAVDAE